MFEIKVARHHDGRYHATIPGLHASCAGMGNSAEAAVRMAQVHALNIIADFIRSSRPLPDAMKCWFHVAGETGITEVGGCQDGTLAHHQLIHPDRDVPPPSPISRSLPNLPKPGSPEYKEFMARMHARRGRK